MRSCRCPSSLPPWGCKARRLPSAEDGRCRGGAPDWWSGALFGRDGSRRRRHIAYARPGFRDGGEEAAVFIDGPLAGQLLVDFSWYADLVRERLRGGCHCADGIRLGPAIEVG